MKKYIALCLTAILALGATACSKKEEPAAKDPAAETPAAESITLKVGATPSPHAEILAVVKEVLAEEGVTLEIVEFNDYVQPNTAVEDGSLDANFFQHQPYLDNFNTEKGTHLVSIASVHYEPLGIYAGKTAAVEALAEGAQIAVPNDTTNEARALLLLEAQGLIKVNPDAGLNATKNDIVENPLKLEIVEIEAAQLARSLQDVDMAVINGNYALQAGLNAQTDALSKEEKDSLAATTYANILCVKEGNEEAPGMAELKAAILSDTVRDYIESTYEGAVVPMF